MARIAKNMETGPALEMSNWAIQRFKQSTTFLRPYTNHSYDFCRVYLGTEDSPEDELLQALTNAWILAACCLVQAGKKSWENFLGHYQSESWQSLGRTEQTRKYTCYFLANVIERDHGSYESNKTTVLSLWMSALVERESILKHQNLLTSALLNNDSNNPVFLNLPFWKSGDASEYVISAKTFSDRRLSLISSILSNPTTKFAGVVSVFTSRYPKTSTGVRGASSRIKCEYERQLQGAWPRIECHRGIRQFRAQSR